jgi:hypothetical protein
MKMLSMIFIWNEVLFEQLRVFIKIWMLSLATLLL